MRKLPTFISISIFLLFGLLLESPVSHAQSRIDWSKDTMSMNDAKGARDTYLNMVRGAGQKNATEQIMLPVDKLKEVMDACAANNVTEVAVMMVCIRQSDLSRYRRINPESSATDDQLKGSQMIIFRVPREAFAGKMGAKISPSTITPLATSLLAAGLVVMEKPFKGLGPATGNVFLAFGKICPPPASCNF